jgi:hypothetical protein
LTWRHRLRLVFFPGIWMLSFVVLWLGHFRFPPLIDGTIGLVSYFATRWSYRADPRPYLHPGVSITLIVAVSMLVPLVTRDPSWDPLGTAWIPTGIPGDYDAWNGGCGARQRDVSNAAHLIATLREVECTGAPIIPPSRDYFVFVHGADETPNRRNLILAYREWADDDAGDNGRVALRIVWTDESVLTIVSGRPSQVRLSNSHVNGITVDHVIGKGVRLPDNYQYRSGNGWQSFEPSADFWLDSHW